jgi:mevalonate kinase
MKLETHKSNGKLLLTGEYVVLDGGLSLAIPTKFGQSLEINSIKDPKIRWKSFDYKNQVWFEDEFTLQEITSGFKSLRNDTSKRLLQILQVAKQLNPAFLKSDLGFEVTSKLDFPQDWGLGSSSTLINNIANWAHIDAYKLLELTFGGSGYDVACAQHDVAIAYQLSSNNQRIIKEVTFNPCFKEALYFVYLNKKQNSRDGIAQYKANTADKTQAIKEISDITSKLISCSSLNDFNFLLNSHEQLISNIIYQVPVKENLFPDFNGSIKSLGAWGGDFVLVTSEENPTAYFRNKGYDTIVPYSEMIK